MSVIDKEPFISQILNTLTAAQAVALKSLINGGGPGPVYRSLIPASPALLTKSEYANCPLEVQLEVSGVTSQRLYTGYLIFDGDDTNHEHCVLIAYSGMQNQQLTVIDIHYVNGLWDYTIKNGDLSIVELRMELDTLSDSEQVEVIETVKEAIANGDIVVGTTVVANPTEAATSELTKIKIANAVCSIGDSVTYLTTAPSANNTSGRMIFVVLSEDPATKYDGYFYIITGSNA